MSLHDPYCTFLHFYIQWFTPLTPNFVNLVKSLPQACLQELWVFVYEILFFWLNITIEFKLCIPKESTLNYIMVNFPSLRLTLPPYFTWDQSEQYEHFLFDRTFELGRI